MLIVFEGIDNAGKTTQIKKIEDYLKSINKTVSIIRFPDRTNIVGKEISKILNSNNDPSETLQLYCLLDALIRLDHLIYQIKTNDYVITDRYPYSAIIYNKLNNKQVNEELINLVVDKFPKPDILFIFNHSYKEGDEIFEKKDKLNKASILYEKFYELNKSIAILINKGSESEIEKIIKNTIMNKEIKKLTRKPISSN
jgi:dTMP kinase